MLILHIRQLDPSSLAGQVYRTQVQNSWPGLAKEAALICKTLNIEDVNTTIIDNKKYRKVVTRVCHVINEKWLRARTRGKTKSSRIIECPYGKKEYILNEKVAVTRDIFKTKTFMQPFTGNYPKYNRFSVTNWLCACKETKEEESHLLSGSCPVYGDLVSPDDDLAKDETLVRVLQDILERRDLMEENV